MLPALDLRAQQTSCYLISLNTPRSDYFIANHVALKPRETHVRDTDNNSGARTRLFLASSRN